MTCRANTRLTSAEARVIFYNRFGHNPSRVSCPCCGANYSATESPTLREATAYNRHCAYDRQAARYCEAPSGDWTHIPLRAYLRRNNILVMRAKDIDPRWRKGDVPDQGYAWRD